MSYPLIVLPFFPKLALFYLKAGKDFFLRNYNMLNYNHILRFLLIGMLFA